MMGNLNFIEKLVGDSIPETYHPSTLKTVLAATKYKTGDVCRYDLKGDKGAGARALIHEATDTWYKNVYGEANGENIPKDDFIFWVSRKIEKDCGSFGDDLYNLIEDRVQSLSALESWNQGYLDGRNNEEYQVPQGAIEENWKRGYIAGIAFDLFPEEHDGSRRNYLENFEYGFLAGALGEPNQSKHVTDILGRKYWEAGYAKGSSWTPKPWCDPDTPDSGPKMR
jgi:hypothetical protein